MVTAITFSQDYVGFAVAPLALDAVVFASLLAGASGPRSSGTEFGS
jgi:hypothetical protein